MDQAAIERLSAKTAAEAIVERLQHDFNLSRIVAQTLLEQVRIHFENYYDQKVDTGQLTYLAVSIDSPAGRRIEACRRVSVRLTLTGPDDLVALRAGTAALRQARIVRWTAEAYDQGGLLTHEDLALLLCSSLATIKRDVKVLRQAGTHVPTRGQIKDIGKGVSHKAQIVRDYLAGYTYSEIEQRRRHSLSSISRYCGDFVRVIRLHHKQLSVPDMQRALGLSERLIAEYLQLHQSTDPANERLQLLLAVPDPATEVPAQIKRGACCHEGTNKHPGEPLVQALIATTTAGQVPARVWLPERSRGCRRHHRRYAGLDRGAL